MIPIEIGGGGEIQELRFTVCLKTIWKRKRAIVGKKLLLSEIHESHSTHKFYGIIIFYLQLVKIVR